MHFRQTTMKKPLTRILTDWLNVNEGQWNKAALVSMVWKYPDSYKSYSPETVGRKLRIIAEEGLVSSEIRNGQTWYWGQKPKQWRYDEVEIGGEVRIRPVQV